MSDMTTPTDQDTMSNDEIDAMLDQINETLNLGRVRRQLDMARECGIVAPNDAVLKFAQRLVADTVERCATLVEGVDVESERQYWGDEFQEWPELDGRYYAQVLRNRFF